LSNCQRKLSTQVSQSLCCYLLLLLYNLIYFGITIFVNLCRNYRTILFYEMTNTILYCHSKEMFW
jgi:hypothetical protein